jgi:hypothetical protein
MNTSQPFTAPELGDLASGAQALVYQASEDADKQLHRCEPALLLVFTLKLLMADYTCCVDTS